MSNFEVSGFPLIDSGGNVVASTVTTDVIKFSFLGIGSSTSKAYTYGGAPSPGNIAYTKQNVETFPFASDASISEYINITPDTDGKRYGAAGHSSETHGYFTGGRMKPSWAPPAGYTTAGGWKIPFSSPVTAVSTPLILAPASGKQYHAGHQSETAGYASGGMYAPPNTATYFAAISKFPFATETDEVLVGNLAPGVPAASGAAGQSGAGYGYTSGGSTDATTPGIINFINRFPFAVDENATDVGDLSAARYQMAGLSSSSDGYNSGGYDGSHLNTIDKFPFSSLSNATDIGNLSLERGSASGASSSTSGYTVGGARPYYGGSHTDDVDKFPFSTDTNATKTGDLGTARSLNATTQG